MLGGDASSSLWLEPCALAAPARPPSQGHMDRALAMPYLIDLLNPPVDAIKGPAVCDVVDQDHPLGEAQSLVDSLAGMQATQAHTHNQLTSQFTYVNTKHIILICLPNVAVIRSLPVIFHKLIDKPSNVNVSWGLEFNSPHS